MAVVPVPFASASRRLGYLLGYALTVNGGFKNYFDRVAYVLLRGDSEGGFFGKLDEAAEVSGEGVEDFEAGGGVEGVPAMEGIEADVDGFGFGAMS
jgi:hypothetical protein